MYIYGIWVSDPILHHWSTITYTIVAQKGGVFFCLTEITIDLPLCFISVMAQKQCTSATIKVRP